MAAYDPEDDIDSSEAASVDAAMERFGQRVAESQERDDGDTPQAEAEGLGEPEPPDEEVFEVQDEEELKRRAEKKRERGILRREAEEMRRQNLELQQRLARLEGYAQAVPQMVESARGPQVDPIDQAIENLSHEALQLRDAYLQRNAQLQASGQRMSREEELDWVRRQNGLERRKYETFEARTAQQRQYEHAAQTIHAIRAAHFPDVVANPRAMQFAQGAYDQLIAKGAQPGLQTMNAAMQAAQQEFSNERSTGRKPPTESEKARYRGVAAGSGSAGKSVRVTREIREIALAMRRPGETDRQAIQRWVNTTGKNVASADRG